MKISKEIQAEGITEDLVKNLDFKIDGIKVQLEKDSEIVEVLRTGNAFFVIKADGTYLKDKGGYAKITETEAKIGLARYVLNHKEEYKDFLASKKTAEEIKTAQLHENKILKEIVKLKSKVDSALSEQLKKMGEIYLYSDKKEKYNLEKIVLDMEKTDHPELYQAKREMAEKLVDDGFIDLHNRLQIQRDLKENKDYDYLYQVFFQEGSPQIASFSYGKPQDMEALKKYFSRESIESTVDMIKENSHLRNVAIFNVEKK